MRNFLFLFLFYRLSSAFSPVFIGPPFRESSVLSYNQSEVLSNNCGYTRRSDKSEYPWAVSLVLDGQHRLGGTIISPYHILTVAHGFMKFQMGTRSHCVAAAYRPLEDIQRRVVVYGGRCIRGDSETHINHPDCPYPDVVSNKIRSVLLDGEFAALQCQDGHDFAIIELEKKIEFNDRIAPICLPSIRSSIQKILMVPSWGRSDIFKESGPLLHEIPMLVDSECRRPWSDKLPFEAADLLCATSLDTRDYNAPRICHGDSGSGMEQRDEKRRASIIALTSFGTIGCPANMLGRFTRVDHYLKTICNYTGVCYSLSTTS